MKKLLGIVVAIALIVWVISWFRAPGAVATSGARPWPGGMGRLDAAAKRVSSQQQANPASTKLATLGNALPKSEALDEFVWREMTRAELTIGDAPAVPDVSAVRELLLREPMVWEHRLEVGDAETSETRAMQLTVARMLVASALTKARANDPAAWEDLHAVWKLARSLDGHPQVMMQTAALAMVRMINAVAWKMPLPAPAWLAEVYQRDHVRPLLEAFQQQTASYWADGAQMFPTKMLAGQVEHDRAIAEQLFNTTQCDVNAPVNELGTDMTSVWRRVFRYRAEREASANALRVREGKPIEARSVCSDGSWTFDGTTLRFSREIATTAPDRPMPLVLRVSAARP
ncbi:MAG TPA: hypothetical protein VEK11_14310 [Thermoanaerobaculia bacterium]|nr:hypothetical protein [Thermoanaerobaculia bacterium]